MFQTSIQSNCVGVAIVVVMVDGSGAPIDLSAVSTISFIFKSPVSGTAKVTNAGTVDSPGTLGSVRYVLASGDLVDIGTWKFQVQAQWADGRNIYSKVGSIIVNANV